VVGYRGCRCVAPYNRLRISNLRNRVLERFELHRLADVVIHTRIETFFPIALQGVSGHRDDPGVSRGAFTPTDLPGGFIAVHFRHLAVHEHHVIGEARHRLHGLASVGYSIDFYLELLEL